MREWDFLFLSTDWNLGTFWCWEKFFNEFADRIQVINFIALSVLALFMSML